MSLKYSGDVTALYDKETGTGTIGKIVGAEGRWFLIVNARYDAETDTTHCDIERLPDPGRVLDRMLEADE